MSKRTLHAADKTKRRRHLPAASQIPIPGISSGDVGHPLHHLITVVDHVGLLLSQLGVPAEQCLLRLARPAPPWRCSDRPAFDRARVCCNFARCDAELTGVGAAILESEAADFHWQARVRERYLGQYTDDDLRAAKARELQAITVREQNPELAAELSARNRIGLLELFDRYAAMPGRSPKTMAQWRPYLAKLAAFIGDDDANAVTHAHLQNWRNHLRDHATYRDKRLRQVPTPQLCASL